MIFAPWEGLFLGVILISLILGTRKGGLRTMTFFAAHLFPFVFALVFTPSVGELIAEKAAISLSSWFPLFVPVYLLPMIILTQLFRVLYKKSLSGMGEKKGLVFRMGGFLMGLLTGVFFSLALTWLLLLQPWISRDLIYRWGGTVFNHAALLLQVFMRFYV